ncbi:hypothetical protein [Xenophilus sp. Marseille-Q4582]|uniref:hypothetical protein n=1 Tax=Xenophilus sp. Marseille-Q4582 TaxID=2866600 RepID=UPI001CE4A343|nr:hypothetical protein [Xenophilus sp. Marseille-Q4582]
MNALIDAMSYRNASDAPTAGLRVVTITQVTDSGASNNTTATSITANVSVVPVNDAPTGSVTISGTAAQHSVLTAAHTLSDPDGLGPLSYQWLRGGQAIDAATGETYTLTQADVGQAISVRASYVDLQGTPESVTSSSTATVANVNDAPTGAVPSPERPRRTKRCRPRTTWTTSTAWAPSATSGCAAARPSTAPPARPTP